MVKLTVGEEISIKNNPEINEAMIQDFIYKNPFVLWLGDIQPLTREKKQPTWWRLDLYMWNENNQRYEIEIQLWDTDPSHIIRTIEYWDNERKKYPNYDHCAVIVAENITWRFMNVISLFNGNIPLIAIKMTAYKEWDDYRLVFTKVLDRIALWNEEDEISDPVDRWYWEKRASKKTLSFMDDVFKDLSDFTKNYSLKYNKFYIWLTIDWMAKNFIDFKPQKNQLIFEFKSEKDEKIETLLDNAWILYWFVSSPDHYFIRLKDMNQYLNNRELIYQLTSDAYSKINS